MARVFSLFVTFSDFLLNSCLKLVGTPRTCFEKRQPQLRCVASVQDVNGVSDEANGDTDGVDTNGYGPITDIGVPKTRRPTTFKVNVR